MPPTNSVELLDSRIALRTYAALVGLGGVTLAALTMTSLGPNLAARQLTSAVQLQLGGAVMVAAALGAYGLGSADVLTRRRVLPWFIAGHVVIWLMDRRVATAGAWTFQQGDRLVTCDRRRVGQDARRPCAGKAAGREPGAGHRSGAQARSGHARGTRVGVTITSRPDRCRLGALQAVGEIAKECLTPPAHGPSAVVNAFGCSWIGVVRPPQWVTR
jgi:hypothetical protein